MEQTGRGVVSALLSSLSISTSCSSAIAVSDTELSIDNSLLTVDFKEDGL
jgi:hypothetical protein